MRPPHSGRPGGKPPSGPGGGRPPHGPGGGNRHGGTRGRDERGGHGGTSNRDERGGRDQRPPRAGEPRAQPNHAGPNTLRARPEARPESRPDSRPDRREHRPPRPARGPEGRREGVDAPRGGVWIYGLHAVAAALANPQRRVRRLVLTEEAEAQLAQRLPPPWPSQPERSERARIDQLLGRDAVHQGFALLTDPLAPPLLATALERPGPVLVLDQVSDPRNVGAILRSAAAFGAACVITQDRNAPEETGALAKAASGALESVPLLRAVNIARTLIALKAAGCWVVGLDSGGSGVLTGSAFVERRVALVLGAEGEGLRRLTRDTCDEIAMLAMPGVAAGTAGAGIDSLNVSAAAAVALYELTRRS
jgi:23S rRNA (guanosine2251-2'-O)-methyltransferase